jgi:hypothetical protein
MRLIAAIFYLTNDDILCQRYDISRSDIVLHAPTDYFTSDDIYAVDRILYEALCNRAEIAFASQRAISSVKPHNGN